MKVVLRSRDNLAALKKLLDMDMEQDPEQPFSSQLPALDGGERLASPLLKPSDIRGRMFPGISYRLKY